MRSESLRSLSSALDHVCFTGRGTDIVKNLQDHVDSSLTLLNLGRPISEAEISCSLAHKRALEVARSAVLEEPELQWVLIVEDDADLNVDKLLAISQELYSSEISVPALVTFYVPVIERTFKETPRQIKSRSFVRTRLWIPGAVAYAVNRAAILDLVTYAQLPVDCTPDWPLYFQRIQRFVATKTWVEESGAPTTLGVRARMPFRKRIGLHFLQIANIERIARTNGVSRRAVVNHLIVTPILRDLRNLLRRIL